MKKLTILIIILFMSPSGVNSAIEKGDSWTYTDQDGIEILEEMSDNGLILSSRPFVFDMKFSDGKSNTQVNIEFTSTNFHMSNGVATIPDIVEYSTIEIGGNQKELKSENWEIISYSDIGPTSPYDVRLRQVYNDDSVFVHIKNYESVMIDTTEFYVVLTGFTYELINSDESIEFSYDSGDPFEYHLATMRYGENLDIPEYISQIPPSTSDLDLYEYTLLDSTIHQSDVVPLGVMLIPLVAWSLLGIVLLKQKRLISEY